MGKYVVKTNEKGGASFTLVASNGQVIGTSEHYQSEKNCLNGIESVRKNAAKANVEDQTQENYEVAKHPKFEIYNDKRGEFRFRLKATNGEIILASEGYTTKAACLNGVESVKKNSNCEVK